MTLLPHDGRPMAAAILESDAETVELAPEAIRDATARTFAPIIRGFLVPVLIFYVLIGIPHVVLRAPADAVLLFSLSASTAVATFLLRRSLRLNDASFLRLELVGSAVLMMIYVNTCAVLYVDFHPANLIYLLLLMMLASTVGISMRVVAGVSGITLATMLVLAFIHGRETFFYYSFVGLAGAFSAIGLAILMRGAILKAVRSRLLAESLRERAERQADFDALSGLPNRRSYFANLEQMMAAPGASVYVGIIDLDGFKPVNDLYGHAVGDDLLVEVAARIRNACPPAYLVARLGGDEFALAIDRTLSPDTLTHLGAAICEALRRPFTISGISIAISGSIGFAHFPTNGTTAREIYERADHALYCAKRATRGDVVIFTDRHEAEMNDYGLIEQTLRNADLMKELYLDFQPQFDILTERTSGFEALARWASPTLGTVNPGLFIAAAERTGMIERITGILLQKAIAAALTWPPKVSLSFNLSPMDLVSPRSIANVTRIVRESGIAPERLTFEITETMVMSDFECARESLVALADMGCRIALDDFGSGYSSFAYIHRFPLHRLKTDRCFVTQLADESASGFGILLAIAELCANLGLECLAEGVETEEEMRSVRQAGVRFVQGYLYGRPMNAAAAAAHAAAQHDRNALSATG